MGPQILREPQILRLVWHQLLQQGPSAGIGSQRKADPLWIDLSFKSPVKMLDLWWNYGGFIRIYGGFMVDLWWIYQNLYVLNISKHFHYVLLTPFMVVLWWFYGDIYGGVIEMSLAYLRLHRSIWRFNRSSFYRIRGPRCRDRLLAFVQKRRRKKWLKKLWIMMVYNYFILG